MREIIVLGAIGKNPRKNRDGFRVLAKGGTCVGLQAHISIEPPLIMRKYERNNQTRECKR